MKNNLETLAQPHFLLQKKARKWLALPITNIQENILSSVAYICENYINLKHVSMQNRCLSRK